MRFLSGFAALCLFLTTFTVVQPVYADDIPWEPVAPGIDYAEFHLPDPNQVFVARMDRSNPDLILDSGLANGRLTQERETVLGIAERYDEALSFWQDAPGSRNKVVVAINGSYIDRLTGLVLSGQAQSGWYVKRFDDQLGGSGFAFKMDRSAFIGECVIHERERQYVTYPNSGVIQFLDGLNIPREEDTLVLYTPQYSPTTLTNNDGLEVLVEMDHQALLTSAPRAVTGFVRAIRDGAGSTSIPFDHVVLSAHGKARERLLGAISISDPVEITQELRSYHSDCKTPMPYDWSKTYATIHGAFGILRAGEIYQMDDRGAIQRHPRTAIAYNDQYIFFIVVDGRMPGRSIGMTFDELAYFARDTLGANWAIAQDGGGSSTMVINDQVVNQPVSACSGEVYLPIVSAGSGGARTPRLPEELYRCLRPVGNAMMMIQLEPAQRSEAFSSYDIVATNGETLLRLGPGTNYEPFATLPGGQRGVIQYHMGDLEGIYARGYYWWKVRFGELSGWVAEESLQYLRTPPSNIPQE